MSELTLVISEDLAQLLLKHMAMGYFSKRYIVNGHIIP